MGAGRSVKGRPDVPPAVGNGEAGEADLPQGAHRLLPSRQDAVGAVCIRGEGDLSASQREIALQDVPPGQEVARAARGGIDLEDLVPFDDPGQDVVEQGGKVGVAQRIVGIGRVARSVADVRHDVVGVGRVQALAHFAKIGAVRLLLRLSGKVLRIPGISAAHRMHAVHDKVRPVACDDVGVFCVRGGIGSIAELSARKHAHSGRICSLQAARFGKVRLRVDHGDGLPLGEHAVRKVVVIEVLGNAVVLYAQFPRAGEHPGQGGLAVGGKGAVGMNVGQHTRMIARFGYIVKPPEGGGQGAASEEAARRDKIALARRRHLFDDGVIARRVQDIVVPQVERDVADALHARLVVALRVGVEQQIPAFDVLPRDGDALCDLRARRDVEQDARARVEDILHEGGAVKGVRGEALEEIAAPVVQAGGAVDVGDAQKFQSLVDDALDAVVRLVEERHGRICRIGADVGSPPAVSRLVPSALAPHEMHHIALVDLPERGVSRPHPRADVESVCAREDVLRLYADHGRILRLLLGGFLFGGFLLRLGGGALFLRRVAAALLRQVLLRQLRFPAGKRLGQCGRLGGVLLLRAAGGGDGGYKQQDGKQKRRHTMVFHHCSPFFRFARAL